MGEFSSDEEAGKLEEVRSAVIENVTMYAQKYDEEFGPHLPPFVEVVWNLLRHTGRSPAVLPNYLKSSDKPPGLIFSAT